MEVKVGRKEGKNPEITTETIKILEAILEASPQSRINRRLKALKGRETSPHFMNKKLLKHHILNKEPLKHVMSVEKNGI